MKPNIIAALILAGSMTVGIAAPSLAKEKLTGEAKLAKTLEGREAGKPVSCLPLGQSNQSTIIDRTAIVYRFGRTLYVNRPTNPQSLDNDDILVTRLTTGQLCRLDTVQLRDRSNFFYSGFVGLQDFVPYTKVKVASAN